MFEEYIQNNYGICKLEENCKCLKNVWLGKSCINWIPVKAKNWDEFREEQWKILIMENIK